MSLIRKAASRWLSAMIRHSPARSREWGNAMLRETDFAESDWSALLWALGSAAALCRYSVSERLRALGETRHQLYAKRVARGMLPMLSGAGAALAFLGICIAALSGLLHSSWFDPAQQKLADRLLVVAIPETVYLAGVLALWRRRKTFAVGILGSGLLLMAHAFMHFTSNMR